MPPACWSSQSRSGRSQSQIVQIYIAISVAHSGCRVRRHRTSPITIQTAFNPNDPLPLPISTDNVYGVVSIHLVVGDDHRHPDLCHAGDARRQRRRAASWRSSRCCGGTAGRGVVATAMTLAALGLFGAALFFGQSMITPAISPGSDRNSLNRAVRAVLADGGSVLIIHERVADAFARPRTTWSATTTPGREAVTSPAGTTIQRDPRDGEPWRAGGDALAARGEHETAAASSPPAAEGKP